MKNEKWYVSSWAVSIGTMLLTFAGTLIIDYFKEKPILSTVSNVGIWLGEVLIAFLTFDIKVWWLLVGVIISVLLLYIASKVLNSDTDEPEYTKYTEDILKIWKWTWKWSYNKISNKWTVHTLLAHCPKCDTRMVSYSGIVKYKCPRCEFEAGAYTDNSYAEDVFMIQQIIIDNVRRNEFQIK